MSIVTVLLSYLSLDDAHLIEARPKSGFYVAQRPVSLPEPTASTPPAESLAVDVTSLAARIMHLAHDPGFISFGAACVGAELFSEEKVRRAVSRAVQRHRASLSEYTTGYGDESLQRAIARHAVRFGCQLEPRNIIITNSCLESITLCLRAVTSPGDVVALESPTLFAFLEILEYLHLRALEIPTHPRTGFSLDALQFALETQPVKAVLAVPTLSNPIGSTIPASDRRRLATMMAESGIPLIEDVTNNDLAELDEQRYAVRSYDTSGQVMMCGSFSKTIAPGLRLGWLDAGSRVSDLIRMKEATSGSQTLILQRALADLLGQSGIEAGFRQIRATIATRIDEARGLIANHFPAGTRVTDPSGGFILWIELPRDVDALQLSQACLAEKIVIAPGKMFSASGRFDNCFRLGVGGAWDDKHRDALRRLGALARGMSSARPNATAAE